MSDGKDQDAGKGRLSLRPAGRLELGRTVDAGSVRQSFSHGRSKVVQVEVRKKRAPIPTGTPASHTQAPQVAAPAPAPVAPTPVTPIPAALTPVALTQVATTSAAAPTAATPSAEAPAISTPAISTSAIRDRKSVV